MSRRDDFSKGVKDVLAHRAGYRCSKPDCRAPTAGPSSIGPDRKSSVGVAAHITAASPGGPRYDDSLRAEVRSSAENGIWLCEVHAKAVDDDEILYTVEILRAWKEHAEHTARALLGRPISGHTLDAAVEVFLQRQPDDALVGVGTTNLPSGTKVWVQLRDTKTGRYLGTSKVEVFDRHFISEGLPFNGDPLSQDWYSVTVLAYFNGPWQQRPAVIEITGTEGANLVGPFAEPIDPDVDDSHIRLNATFECLAPPFLGTKPLDDQQLRAAIEVLKRSVLHARGRDEPSAEPVGEVVRFFIDPKCNLTEKDGWTASEVAPGVVEARYSFWNGERPDDAIWHIIPSCESVRYRNRHAKWLSWLARD